jgi:uncharacterized membrane protein (UPF0182 family)
VSQSPPRPASAGATRRGRPSPLILTIIAVVVLLVLFVAFSQVYTEGLWFNQLGSLSVFGTQWISRIVLFLIGFVLLGVAVWLPLFLAHRYRPVYAPTTPRQENLDRYREAIEPLRKGLTIVVPVVVGLLGGLALAPSWKQALEFVHRTPFGEDDPQFGLDLGFYVFTLPVLQTAVNFLGTALLLTVIAGLIAHYLMGGIRPAETKGLTLTRAAKVQLAISAALLLLSQAARLFLGRFSALMDDSGLVTGATYSAVNITLPALLIVSVAAAVVALLLAVNAFRPVWRLSIVSVVMLLVLGGVAVLGLPAAVQQFKVQPSESNLEREYIQRNIDATRSAYGIADVDVKSYEPKTTAASGALASDAETAASIRLLDPNLVSDTFRQLQQQRPFYSFPEQLDVDRYHIDGQTHDSVIAVRELNANSQSDSSWLNQRVVYTHGFGVVSAYGNKQGNDGQPVFMESNIPPKGILGDYEERVYFGESSPTYSIVGAPDDADPREIDYPSDEGDGQVYNTFKGDGGPKVGNLFNRLLYAIKFQDEQIVLSDALNPDSQILYDRAPRERVEKVAPFLEVDGDPYPAVIDGRIKWIVDGYTTSASYPYSKPETLGDATRDSVTQRSGNTVQALPDEKVNYIRNSVKATVDAYDGSVDLYAWDDKDPVLQTWQKVFPGMLKPLSDMSGDLMSHVRYPEDLFKVQRSLLSQYHVADAASFYTRQDFWSNPVDPTADSQGNSPQPPYYLTMKMPGQDQAAFSLTSTFIPRQTEGQSRNNLTGFLAADADAGSTAGKPAETYGKLRLLQLPRNTTFPGPGQAQNNFNTDPTVQEALLALRRGNDSTVQSGNLLTLPVADGLLYVQPVYVRSSGQTSYPKLQRVIVAFGDKIGFAATLDEALNQVFGGNSGADAGDAGTDKQDEDSGSSNGSGGDKSGDAKTDRSPSLNKALKDAKQAMEDSDAAMKAGDWAKYGQAQKRLQAAIDAAQKAEAEAKK